MTDLYPFLRKVPYFQSLNDDEISIIKDTCREELFDSGAVIFREGEPGNKLFIVVGGSVEIWKFHNTPGQDLLSVFGPGQLFGELALIDNSPRSATVVARQKCRLLSINREDFNRITLSNPVSKAIMRSLSDIIRKRTETFARGIRIRDRKLEKTCEELKKAEQKKHTDIRRIDVDYRKIHKQFCYHLQIIAEMMNLQAEYIGDAGLLNIFRRSWNRVNALSIFHETLVEQPDAEGANSLDYINRLVKSLYHSFRIRSGDIRVDILVEELRFKPEEAFPVGLIITELLSGPFIRAASDGSLSRIKIRLRSLNPVERELRISTFNTLFSDESDLTDTGISVSDLVRSLAENYLKGRLVIKQNEEIRFIIRYNTHFSREITEKAFQRQTAEN